LEFILAFWNFSHKVNYVFVEVLALQSVLKLFFPLLVVIASFGDAVKLFIIIFLFSLRESGRLFV
jgi:hypothetical protein